MGKEKVGEIQRIWKKMEAFKDRNFIEYYQRQFYRAGSFF